MRRIQAWKRKHHMNTIINPNPSAARTGSDAPRFLRCFFCARSSNGRAGEGERADEVQRTISRLAARNRPGAFINQAVPTSSGGAG